MPECFECTTLAKKRYINTLPFLSFPLDYTENRREYRTPSTFDRRSNQLIVAERS